MKIEYDERADLLYLRLDPRTQDVLNRRVSDDVVLDMGQGQMIVGGRGARETVRREGGCCADAGGVVLL